MDLGKRQKQLALEEKQKKDAEEAATKKDDQGKQAVSSLALAIGLSSVCENGPHS